MASRDARSPTAFRSEECGTQRPHGGLGSLSPAGRAVGKVPDRYPLGFGRTTPWRSDCHAFPNPARGLGRCGLERD
jgi:hypothetical protein